MGVKMTAGAQGATLSSNIFQGLKGGAHSADGGENAAFGVWIDEDSVAHDIEDTNVHEGEPIVYIHGADGLVLEDLQLTGPGNPTNLGKLAIVASKNVTVLGGEFANQRGAEGMNSAQEWAASPGGRAVGILLRDCEGCAVEGATVHHIEGGRGGVPYTTYTGCCGIGYVHSQGPGTGGWSAGIALEGSSTVGCTLSGNVFHDLQGGAEPPCLSEVCVHATQFRQGAVGIYVAEESMQNTIAETNLLDSEPILYRYGAQDEVLEGYTISRNDLGTNWGQVAIFESAGVTLRDLEISGVMGIQGTDPGWDTAAVQLQGCQDCSLRRVKIHDVEGGKGTSSGKCTASGAGGMAMGLRLSQVTGLEARNVLVYDVRGGKAGNTTDQELPPSSWPACDSNGVGGSAHGIWMEDVNGSIQHVTVTGLEGGAGASHQGTESIYQGTQSDGQVVLVRNSILSGASSTCVHNLETNPVGSLQVYNTGLHACGSDNETWAMNTALVSANLFVDPLFESPSKGDYRLSSASAHIDAGYPDDGLCAGYAQEPSPNGCAPNMGFYGNTSEAATQAGAEHCECVDEAPIDTPDGG